MRARLHLIVLLTLVCLSATAHSVVERDGYYEVSHSWEYNEKQCFVSLNISMDLYDYYRDEREHLLYRYQFGEDETPPSYFSFMLSEQERPVLQALANEFNEHTETELERIDLALTFVQSIPYAFDADSKGVDEYVRYPVETLVDGCGDCEDKVALLVALLYEMDVDFILLVMPNHMAVAVHCDGVKNRQGFWYHDKKYYYMETSMPYWQIGQIPEDYQTLKAQVVPIDDRPSLLMKDVHFESQPSPVHIQAPCTLDVELHNLGPGRASQVVLHVRIVEKGLRNHLLAEDYFPLNDLGEGEIRTEKLSFKSLIKENCFLEIELTGDDVEPQYRKIRLNYKRRR